MLYKKQDMKQNILIIIDNTRILRLSQTTSTKFYHEVLRLNFIFIKSDEHETLYGRLCVIEFSQAC